MASEFDNEIDSLLRQTPQQNNFAREDAAEIIHLDADDLAAFTENALPQFVRLNFISHLADCNLCRETLSNLILLNEAADLEANNVAAPEKTIAVAHSSWLGLLKKLFAFPAVGYATAILAILFVGVFAFVALRPDEVNQTAQLVRTEALPIETPQERKRSAAPAAESKDEEIEPEAEESPTETPDLNTNIAVENTPAPATEPAESLPPSVRLTKSENSGNRNVVAPETSATRSSSTSSNSVASRQPQPSAESAGTIAAQRETSGGAIAPVLPAAPKSVDKAKMNLLAGESRDQALATEGNRELKNFVPPAIERRSAIEVDRKSLKKLAETRAINGKTFQKIGGVWQDTAYSSQNLTNVSRGSGEYKKLDNNLRSVAEKLSGEIIIVWQGKAYKIR